MVLIEGIQSRHYDTERKGTSTSSYNLLKTCFKKWYSKGVIQLLFRTSLRMKLLKCYQNYLEDLRFSRRWLKILVFWDATRCSLAYIYQLFYPEDGSSTLLWNVGKYLPDYTTAHPRRQFLKLFQPFSRKSRCLATFMQRSPLYRKKNICSYILWGPKITIRESGSNFKQKTH
jgi:hypothetical protein